MLNVSVEDLKSIETSILVSEFAWEEGVGKYNITVA